MEQIINEVLEDSEIAKYQKAHENKKESGGDEEITARFQYAHALIRSKHSQDMKHGISLMEDLYYNGNQTLRRDYLYYIAIGQTRLKHYNLALDIIEQFLSYEPENRQAKQLRSYIKERLTKDGLFGMAVASGAVLAVGGLISLGVALAKK